jgi:hypothetical protein
MAGDTDSAIHRWLIQMSDNFYAVKDHIRAESDTTNTIALSPLANYTNWATATCWRNLVPTFADRGVSRGQRGGSPKVVNLSFLVQVCSIFLPRWHIPVLFYLV